jgi:hydroxypyruvate isomerase
MTKLKYSICLDAACRGKDPLQALEEVKAAGFEAFEFWRWHIKDLPAMKKKADSLGLTCVSFTGRKGNINLTDPKDHETWVKEFSESVEAAKSMGAKRLIAVSGEDTGAVREFQHKALVKALKAVRSVCEDNNITLLLEPLNGRIDHKGIYLESSDEAFAILDEAGNPNAKLLFDIYHQQITEGDIIRRMLPRIKQIGHVHTAGSDGRHELDIGELNYRKILEALAGADYDGYIGLEYMPIGDSLEGLKRVYDYLHS